MSWNSGGATLCLNDSIISALITKEQGNGTGWDSHFKHLADCPNCQKRQRVLLERAMALVSLDFQPWEWQAFYSHRIGQRNVGQIGIEVGKPWSAVFSASCRVMFALCKKLNACEGNDWL